MESRVVQQAIRKLADLFPNESGRVGAKSALAMGAVVGAAVLAQMIFAPSALAHPECQDTLDCTQGANWCCCSYAGGDHQHCTLRLWCQQNNGICRD